MQTCTEPIWTGAGRYVQLAARQAGADPAPSLLRDVRVVAIDTTEDADTASALAGVVRRAAAAVAGIDLTPPAGAMTTKPRIVTREQWGANESWRSGSPSYAPVKMAFIHHTDSGNAYKAAEAPAIVRGVYAYHTKAMHWSDVGYNFLIDRYGVIYEGRYGGMTRGVSGAQVLGFNTGSTGISVIGTFTSSTPPSAAVTSLERLLEWKLDVHHVDPQGTATLVCGYGQKYATGQHVKFPAIAGHRDANYTDCPGGRLYAQLPNVRKVVARTGQPKIYGFIAGDPSISPNGDGVQDKVTIGFTVSQEATWKVEIRDDAGRLVRDMAGEGKIVELTWGGRDDAGDPLPDGTYTLQADATSAAGVARSATATVRLDTVAPKVESGGASPDPFSPNGDGQDDTTTLSLTPAEAVSARLSVVDAGGDVLRRVTGWKSLTADAHMMTWDGRVGSGSAVVAAPEGTAILLLEARDGAGNTASLRRRVVVDRTLKLTGLSRRTFSPNGDGAHDEVTVSFRLAHAADVVATVASRGSTVRSWKLGALAAGVAVGDLGRQAGRRRRRDQRPVHHQGHRRRRSRCHLRRRGGHSGPHGAPLDGAADGAGGLRQDGEAVVHRQGRLQPVGQGRRDRHRSGREDGRHSGARVGQAERRAHLCLEAAQAWHVHAHLPGRRSRRQSPGRAGGDHAQSALTEARGASGAGHAKAPVTLGDRGRQSEVRYLRLGTPACRTGEFARCSVRTIR